jgi:hypothetical protein
MCQFAPCRLCRGREVVDFDPIPGIVLFIVPVFSLIGSVSPYDLSNPKKVLVFGGGGPEYLDFAGYIECVGIPTPTGNGDCEYCGEFAALNGVTPETISFCPLFCP